MALYEYVCRETGETLEEWHPMEDAPPVGSKIRRQGKVYERVLSRAQLAPVWSRRFVAHSQEPGDPDAPHHVGPERIPAFESQREVDEYAAKKGLVYDDGSARKLRGKKVSSNRKKGS